MVDHGNVMSTFVYHQLLQENGVMLRIFERKKLGHCSSDHSP